MNFVNKVLPNRYSDKSVVEYAKNLSTNFESMYSTIEMLRTTRGEKYARQVLDQMRQKNPDWSDADKSLLCDQMARQCEIQAAGLRPPFECLSRPKKRRLLGAAVGYRLEANRLNGLKGHRQSAIGDLAKKMRADPLLRMTAYAHHHLGTPVAHLDDLKTMARLLIEDYKEGSPPNSETRFVVKMCKKAFPPHLLCRLQKELIPAIEQCRAHYPRLRGGQILLPLPPPLRDLEDMACLDACFGD